MIIPDFKPDPNVKIQADEKRAGPERAPAGGIGDNEQIQT
jgi:hypothetical protein